MAIASLGYTAALIVIFFPPYNLTAVLPLGNGCQLIFRILGKSRTNEISQFLFSITSGRLYG